MKSKHCVVQSCHNPYVCIQKNQENLYTLEILGSCIAPASGNPNLHCFPNHRNPTLRWSSCSHCKLGKQKGSRWQYLECQKLGKKDIYEVLQMLRRKESQARRERREKESPSHTLQGLGQLCGSRGVRGAAGGAPRPPHPRLLSFPTEQVTAPPWRSRPWTARAVLWRSTVPTERCPLPTCWRCPAQHPPGMDGPARARSLPPPSPPGRERVCSPVETLLPCRSAMGVQPLSPRCTERRWPKPCLLSAFFN